MVEQHFNCVNTGLLRVLHFAEKEMTLKETVISFDMRNNNIL